jgi:hypothetical protein
MKGNEQPIYRVLRTVVLSSDRQIYQPGALVDLSHLPQTSIQWFVEQGYYETADGEPDNDITVKAEPCKNC